MKKTPKASSKRSGQVAEMRAEYDFSGGERGKYAKPAGIPNRIFRGGSMTTSKGAYVATAAIAAVGLALSVAALRLINGHWQSLGELGPMIVLYAAMAIFIPYRRSRGLEITPPWLMVGVGAVAIAVYSAWLATADRPSATLGWVGFGLIAAVPIFLLVIGFRRIRQRAHRLEPGLGTEGG